MHEPVPQTTNGVEPVSEVVLPKLPRAVEVYPLTTGEARKLLHVSNHTVINLFNEGQLKGYVLPTSGGHRRIFLGSVIKIIEECNIPKDRLENFLKEKSL